MKRLCLFTMPLLALAAAAWMPVRAAGGGDAPAGADGAGDRIESVCPGGIAAHIHSHSVVERGGQVIRRQRVRADPPAPGRFWTLVDHPGRIAPEEAAALFARLDRIGFESFVPPDTPPAPDYVGCSISRTVGGRTHRVSFRAPMRGQGAGDPREREVRRLISDVHGLVRAATETKESPAGE